MSHPQTARTSRLQLLQDIRAARMARRAADFSERQQTHLEMAERVNELVEQAHQSLADNQQNRRIWGAALRRDLQKSTATLSRQMAKSLAKMKKDRKKHAAKDRKARAKARLAMQKDLQRIYTSDAA